MKRYLLAAITVMYSCCLSAQLPQPTDYLPASFHKGRRDALRAMMPPRSVAVFFASPERNFSNDVNYRYHANPDLYYFSGYTEPNGMLLVFKEKQTAGSDEPYDEVLFVRKKDPRMETWTGKRLGVQGAKEKLGVGLVMESAVFKQFPIDPKDFDHIIYGAVKDLADDFSDPDDVYDLVRLFKEKAGFSGYNEQAAEQYSMMAARDYLAEDDYRPRVMAMLQESAKQQPSLANDTLFAALLAVKDAAGMRAVFDRIRNARVNTTMFNQFTNRLRQIKTPEEMELMRKAIDISSLAHVEAMKAVRSDMSERELQGVQEFIHKKLGAEDVGYGSIVGAGENGCTLHYETNSAMAVGNDMVLMDVGAEYHGYSADVTRTFPTNGKFSREQKQIYDIVYEAQEAVFAICREGTPFRAIEDTASAVVARGLLRLGIISDPAEARKYYPHGCSHFLGLDVHDKGEYDILKENMVITVEPGIYIPPGSDCDKKWWRIAVRIEDDVRIDKQKMELLTNLAPRKTEDIEKVMQQKSFVDDLKLSLPVSPKKGF
ncbi:MAG: aminopeptidase P N-terminal domain-containing protein [Flavihumibacter sp.]